MATLLDNVRGFTKDDNGRALKAPTAWSYSRYSTYKECPAKFAYKFIVKIQEPSNEAMARGNAIHDKADKYVSGGLDRRPPELDNFADLFDMCRDDGKFFTEEQWGFKANWHVTGYFAKDTWLRTIVDLGRLYDDDQHMLLIDHKTGKKYETNEEQVQLFALSAMCRYPAIKTVEARLWYLDSGDEVIREYDARDQRDMQREWEQKVAPMFNDTTFAPRKNKWCYRCFYAASNGGPCEMA